MSPQKAQTKITTKFKIIHELLDMIENYKPLSVDFKEEERLRHYRDVINEDLTFIIESRIRGDIE